MGLDGVELILALEEEFQIVLEDEAVSSVYTIGDLYKLLLSKLPQASAPACTTSMAFYAVRRGLMEELGVSRKDLRPATSLASLFSQFPPRRRQQWHRFRNGMPYKLDHLGVGRIAFWGSAILGASVCAWFAHGALDRLPYTAAAALCGFVLGLIAIYKTACAHTSFPNGIDTVGDLARLLLGKNTHAFAQRTQGWTPENVWQTMKTVVIAQLGVNPELVVPEASIVEDLGCD